MIRGLSSSSKIDYVLSDDPCQDAKGKPTDGATIFHLGTLDGYTMARVQDLLMEAEIIQHDATKAGGNKKDPQTAVNIKMTTYQAAYEACRFGILGWTNFCDPDGKPIPYETETELVAKKAYPVVKRDLLAQLAPNHALELMKKLVETNKVTKTEEKKSGAA